MYIAEFLSKLDSQPELLQKDLSVRISQSSPLNFSKDAFKNDPFALPDIRFEEIFGLPKQLALELYLELLCYIPVTSGTRCIPFHLSILATLSYLKNGNLEHVKQLESFYSYTWSKLLQCVASECEQIVLFLAPILVKFTIDSKELLATKDCFQQRFGVPGVVGVLDCFSVRLQDVKNNDRALFTNRLGQTSVNVQVICDHNYRFLDVNARFPGSCSDIYIWKRSNVRNIVNNLQAQEKNMWLVGDRGYRLDSILINPYRNAISSAEKTFNATLKEVRGVMDKALALLQARFRCLTIQLPFKHTQCANIITACVTLHNYLIAKNYPIETNLSYTVPKIRDLPNAFNEDVSCEGVANREYLKDFVMISRLSRLMDLSCQGY